MDADLRDINKAEIENAISGISENEEIDMIIFRRINASWYIKLNRGDILFSGERIIRKEALCEVLKAPIQGYQLELAINKYMQDHQKTVVWMPGSWKNTYKIQKLGPVAGLLKDLNMYSNLLLRFGLGTFIRQIMYFANSTLERKDLSPGAYYPERIPKQKANGF